MANPILLTSEYRLRRWGLYWIILGAFTLLDVLLHLDNTFALIAAILFSAVIPGRAPQQRWFQWALEFGISIILFIGLGLGFSWLEKVFGFETRLSISMSLLLTGIILQIWAETRLLVASPGQESKINNLIAKIRSL